MLRDMGEWLHRAWFEINWEPIILVSAFTIAILFLLGVCDAGPAEPGNWNDADRLQP